MASTYQCIVVGAGPAGSTAATLLAQAGISTLLVEREKFPRFHVGESLMPETFWILDRLGVRQQMVRFGFINKVGVQFVSHSGRESQPFYFVEHDPRPCSRTWHVERARFDQLLFENAGRRGAQCRDQTRVTDVQFRPGPRATVTLQSADRSTWQAEAQVVVDATGQQCFLANRLGLKVENQHLRKAAIWTYFQGAQRVAPDSEEMTVILHTQDKKAWFWYIPLTAGLVSVGVVGDRDYLLRRPGTKEEIFAQELAKCPSCAQRLEGATMRHGVHATKEFSYSTRQHSGDGWVLIGDAFGFIDPVYSSGVFLAFKSGELAADAIIEGFRRNDLGAEQLGCWTGPFTEGMKWMRKLVHAFYTEPFSFGEFMKRFPDHKGNLTDLLIGRIFHPGAGRIFDDLDPALQEALASSAAEMGAAGSD